MPAATKPAFVGLPLTAIPKRKAPEPEVDLVTANAILAIVSETVEVNGEQVAQTASDGTTYPDNKSARAEANKAARLLRHVLPDGKGVKTRVYETPEKGSGAFAWAVWMVDGEASSPDTENEPETAAEEAAAAS